MINHRLPAACIEENDIPMGISCTIRRSTDDNTTTVILHLSRTQTTTTISNKSKMAQRSITCSKRKRQKAPLSHNLKNKRLRQKSGHPAGLQLQNQEIVQEKIRESEIKNNNNPQQRTRSSDQTPRSQWLSGLRNPCGSSIIANSLLRRWVLVSC